MPGVFKFVVGLLFGVLLGQLTTTPRLQPSDLWYHITSAIFFLVAVVVVIPSFHRRWLRCLPQSWAIRLAGNELAYAERIVREARIPADVKSKVREHCFRAEVTLDHYRQKVRDELKA